MRGNFYKDVLYCEGPLIPVVFSSWIPSHLAQSLLPPRSLNWPPQLGQIALLYASWHLHLDFIASITNAILCGYLINFYLVSNGRLYKDTIPAWMATSFLEFFLKMVSMDGCFIGEWIEEEMRRIWQWFKCTSYLTLCCYVLYAKFLLPIYKWKIEHVNDKWTWAKFSEM